MSAQSTATLPVAEVRAGARLTEAVMAEDGRVLIAVGTVLTQAELESLVRLGVAAVSIEARRTEAELNADREALRQRLTHLFRKCDVTDSHSGAQSLFAAVLKYRLEAVR